MASVHPRRGSAPVTVLVILQLLVLASAPGAPSAQEMRTPPPTRQVELWGGLARNSPRWGILGSAPGMSLAVLALRIERPVAGPVFIGATRRTTLHVDIIPLALMSPPWERVGTEGGPECGGSRNCVARPRNEDGLLASGGVVGVGISPLGITTRFRERRSLSPSVGATAGILLFDRAVPTARSSAFNFTASVEVGLRIGRPEGTGIGLTYRLHHLSNAGTARENPAVASHLITIGLHAPAREIR